MHNHKIITQNWEATNPEDVEDELANVLEEDSVGARPGLGLRDVDVARLHQILDEGARALRVDRICRRQVLYYGIIVYYEAMKLKDD